MVKKIKFYLLTLIISIISARAVLISIDDFERDINIYSLSDLMVQYCSLLLIGFFILPFLLMILNSLNKKYENFNAILSYKSRERIYNNLVKDNIVMCIKFVIVLTITIIAYYKLKYPNLSLINWNSTESCFSLLTNGTIDIGFQWIVFLFMNGLLFASVVTSLFMIVITEYTGSKAYAWVIFLALMVNEMFFGKYAFLVGHALIQYDFVIYQGLILRYMAIGIIEIIVLYALGKRAYLKKDFL